jgi:hypothetical protein
MKEECPYTANLEQMLNDTSTPEQEGVLDHHIDNCPACSRRYVELLEEQEEDFARSVDVEPGQIKEVLVVRSQCPSREQIRRLWEDTLSNYQETKVERHLRVCETCQKVYDGIAEEGEAATRLAVAQQLGMENPDNATKKEVDRAVRRNAAEGIMELGPDDDPSMSEIEDAARALLEVMRLRPEATLCEEEKKRMAKARGFLMVEEMVDAGPVSTPENN